MAGVIHEGGQQIERLNPMQVMEEIVAPGQQGGAVPGRGTYIDKAPKRT